MENVPSDPALSCADSSNTGELSCTQFLGRKSRPTRGPLVGGEGRELRPRHGEGRRCAAELQRRQPAGRRWGRAPLGRWLWDLYTRPGEGIGGPVGGGPGPL